VNKKKVRFRLFLFMITCFVLSNFSVTFALTAPTLLSPVNGQTGIALTPNFLWSKSGNAKKYHIQIATDTLFSTTSIIKKDSTSSSTDTTYSCTTNTLNCKKYYWRVSADSESNSNFSSKYSFTVDLFKMIFLGCNFNDWGGLAQSDLDGWAEKGKHADTILAYCAKLGYNYVVTNLNINFDSLCYSSKKGWYYSDSARLDSALSRAKARIELYNMHCMPAIQCCLSAMKKAIYGEPHGVDTLGILKRYGFSEFKSDSAPPFLRSCPFSPSH
jgi:hypothetical protein